MFLIIQKMNLSFIALSVFLQLILTLYGGSSYSYTTIDDIAINCGFSGTSIASDGRQWIGDIGLQLGSTQKPNGKPISIRESTYIDPVPYTTARISNSQFSYKFQVSPGQKFIRFHFHPASFPGFERSRDFFTVRAGVYTLLRNFSASLTANALAVESFSKEFCVNIEQSQILIITFSPSKTSDSSEFYAFVNGIEIISMPTGLYYTPESDQGAPVVGQNHRFHIDNSTALELVHRVNSGGISILPVEDWGLFRRWSADSNYMSNSGVVPVTTSTPIKYQNIPTYTAPHKVYQTAWSVDSNKQTKEFHDFTWKLPADLGFRYLIRLHFCELDYEIREIGQREFGIAINNKNVESHGDLIRWGGGYGVAVYRDYLVMMEGSRRGGKRDIVITIQLQNYESTTKYLGGAVLNGIEVLKLSNPDNDLSSQNPEPPQPPPTPLTSKLKRLLSAFGVLNATVSGLIILITLLSIAAFQLRVWAEELGQKNVVASSRSEEICRQFSFSEMQLATNNFDEALAIGDGGFGKVYKGTIDKGTTTVAVKRLKTMSKQGAEEFWTEIKLLSNLRHTNLVALIGYCNDGSEMILVYEYMINGTLADHLHKMRRKDDISWEQRLNICIGAARGLEYLHTGAEHRVIHRDVKTSNILLDENWVTKISDFGLSKMGGQSKNQASTYVITDVKGTFGYLDVQYFLTHRLTRKSDVYAFGVVLFEVLCGRPAVDKRFEGEERSLSLWAQSCIKEGKLDQIIDLKIKKEISPHCLEVFAEVAHKCLCNRPNDRPRMSDVVQRLEFALASQDQKIYSSTETEGEQVEESEATNWSMLGNMPINKVVEEEEERDHEEEVVDIQVVRQSKAAEGLTSKQPKPSTDEQKEISNKKTIAKVFQSITKRIDFRRKNMKGNDSSALSLSWWNRNRVATTTIVVRPEDSLSNLPPPPAPICRCFSLSELKAATKNFRSLLVFDFGGPGGSEMYKGYIDDGKVQVAIERCVRQFEEEFLEEIEMRSRIQHPHIVSFIGYCSDSDETILVHEMMLKGSLDRHLHQVHKLDPLPWHTRLEIGIAAAQGLQYLHTHYRGPIIHGEFQSSSILLDEKWAAKVSGLKAQNLDHENKNMTQTVFTTVLRRTLGYMDPEYLVSGKLTTKSDVYSFGVVLLELLSAKEPQRPSLYGDEKNLVNLFKKCTHKKTIERVLDPYLIGKIAPKVLRKFIKIADSCLLFRGVERPSMDGVVVDLQQAFEMQKISGDSLKFGAPNDPPEKIRAAALRAYTKIL